MAAPARLTAPPTRERPDRIAPAPVAATSGAGEGTPTPFHVAPGLVAPATRRMLLVSYTFPPDQTVGALRWQKLARHVVDRGWGLDVLTLHPADMPGLDPARLGDLPAGTRVFGVPRVPPPMERMQRRIMRAVRAVRGVLRRRARPVAPATASDAADVGVQLEYAVSSSVLVRSYLARLDFARMTRLARDTDVMARGIAKAGTRWDAVVSSGPPHMAHEAARRIAHHLGLPFIVDLRDVWSAAGSMPDELASPTWARLARRHERRVVDAAALVVVNTEPFRDALAAQYPSRARDIVTVMNGCDAEPRAATSHGTRFLIASAGSLYAGRNPRLLFRAAARVVRELGLTPSELCVGFLGDVHCDGVPVLDIAREEGFEQHVWVGGRRPRHEALAYLAGAAMLVDLPQHTQLAIPAKIFEYLTFDAWLLALTTPESATGRLLEGSGADLVRPDDVDAIARVLRARIEAYRRGERPVAIAHTHGRFDRGAQAQLLMDAIEARLGSVRA